MKTFEEVCSMVQKSYNSERFITHWIKKYTEYMNAEIQRIENSKLNYPSKNPYYLKKLEIERDFIKYELEEIEGLMEE